MIRANLENLVETCVAGVISNPIRAAGAGAIATGSDGRPWVPVIQGGITLNVRVGDRAFDWAWGEKVMPGVTVTDGRDPAGSPLAWLSCIGNDAIVVGASMDGKDTRLRGQIGAVVGKNTALGLVTIHFPKRTMEKLCIGDRIQIRACGQGMSFPGYPGVAVRNCSPRLLRAINPTEKGGRIRVSVTCILPGKLMAAGPGGPLHSCTAEIQSNSREVVKEYKLENIRLGDFVAIADYDLTYGARYHNGAVTVGVVVHGASNLSGHGLGLSSIFTSAEGLVEPIITRKANLSQCLNLA